MNSCAVNRLKDKEFQILPLFFPAIFYHFWKKHYSKNREILLV